MKFKCAGNVSHFLINGGQGGIPLEQSSRTVEDVDLLMKFKCAVAVKICLQ